MPREYGTGGSPLWWWFSGEMRITRPHTDPQGFVTWHLRSQQKSSNSVVSSVLTEMNWESKCWVTGHAVGKRGWFWSSPTVGCQRMWHMKTFTTLFDVPHQPKNKTLFSERLTMYSRYRKLHRVATLTSLLKRIVHPKMKLCHHLSFHNCRMYFLLWNTKNTLKNALLNSFVHVLTLDPNEDHYIYIVYHCPLKNCIHVTDHRLFLNNHVHSYFYFML